MLTSRQIVRTIYFWHCNLHFNFRVYDFSLLDENEAPHNANGLDAPKDDNDALNGAKTDASVKPNCAIEVRFPLMDASIDDNGMNSMHRTFYLVDGPTKISLNIAYSNFSKKYIFFSSKTNEHCICF